MPGVILIAAILLILTPLLGAGCVQQANAPAAPSVVPQPVSSDTGSVPSLPTPAVKAAPAAAVKATPQTVAVSIVNFSFSPAEIKIKAGDTVRWTNQDGVSHQILSNGDLPELSSSIFPKGESYSFTFAKVGTWGYYCGPHPRMTGKIIVE